MELLIKDFRAFVVARGRQFLEDFIDFIGAPKTFLATATVYTPDNLARAFSFFVILYALVNLLFIFLFPVDLGAEKLVVFNIVYTIVFFTIALLLLQLSWLIVGARPPLRRVMLAFLYFIGIGVLIQMALFIAWIMIAHPVDDTVRAMDHFNALSARDPAAADDYLAANPGLMVQVTLLVTAFVIYLLVDLLWAIVVWGAFRQLAGTGRIRSALALSLFLALSLLLFFLSVFFLQAFVPGLSPA